MINTNNPLLTMNDREYSALQRATASRRAMQAPPKPPRKNRPKDHIRQAGHDLTYWDEQSPKWKVYVKFRRKKIYCGKTYDQDNAPAMQQRKLDELKQA